MVIKEFDLLEDRILKLIEALKGKSIISSGEVKELKMENKELKRKIKLLKDKINKMIKEIDKIEE